MDLAIPEGVTVVSQLDDATVTALEQGGTCSSTRPTVPRGAGPEAGQGGARLLEHLLEHGLDQTPAAAHARASSAIRSTRCSPDFPTDFHSNWQWWYLVSRAGAMILDDLPPDLRPTVQVIDDWFTARRLGLMFEAKVGRGKLAVCSIDLEHDLDNNPVARQFRHSLLQYLASRHFEPQIELTVEQVQQLTAP